MIFSNLKSISTLEKHCTEEIPIALYTTHTEVTITTVGTSVFYYCDEGFVDSGGGHMTTCADDEQWTPVNLTCEGRCG